MNFWIVFYYLLIIYVVYYYILKLISSLMELRESWMCQSNKNINSVKILLVNSEILYRG